MPAMKHVIITFDFEGSWGMPFSSSYDLAMTTQKLLALLDRANAKAVFFVTGKLVEEHPEIVRAIHSREHEIGIHGYLHEHMHNLSVSEINTLATQLDQISEAVKLITGYRPHGFRAPYLMGPRFYDPKVYQMLAHLDFNWVSNREIRYPEELFRPGRLSVGSGLLRWTPLRSTLLLALNANLIRTERPAGKSLWATTRWLLQNPRPYRRPEGLTEYPLTSPLDCDLVGMPDPNTPSPEAVIRYAKKVIWTCNHFSGDTLTINSHDWITGTANRPQILETTLADINTGPVRYFRPGLDGAAR